ncbi:MAG: hypothetical protein ABI481_01600 [Pyrinomonadaceae bacterium]
MTTRYSFFHVLVIITFTSLAGHAQPQEISKDEFHERERSAFSKLEAKLYRERITQWTDPAMVSKEFGSMVSQICEYAPPDRQRTVSVFQMPNGTRKEETIKIGKRTFTRKDDEPWQDVSKRDPNRYSMFGDPIEAKETVTYRRVGIERINGIEGELVEELFYREHKVAGKSHGFGFVNRLWITKDAVLIRRELKGSGSNGLVTSHTITDYEYDPNIRIEAPIK